MEEQPLPNSSACSCLSSLPGDEEMVGCFGFLPVRGGDGRSGEVRSSFTAPGTASLFSSCHHLPPQLPFRAVLQPLVLTLPLLLPWKVGASLPPRIPRDPEKVGEVWRSCLSENPYQDSVSSEQKCFSQFCCSFRRCFLLACL